MAYKCHSCGHIFENGEEFVVKEEDEHTGRDVAFLDRVCPFCKSHEFERTVSCCVCKAEFFEEELNYESVCEECIKEMVSRYKYDASGCYKISRSAGAKDSVKIDSFLASVFSADEIENVLLRELVSALCVAPVDCSAFINADRSWFIEKLMEGVKKS